ncbi:sporulation protein Cse60 [Bacillus sp. FJAT-42376]|uniref:sporulation protein Cse60 n=1 Tax=Bacillus sp. FJAT-42376 TaxID=2014076 RepID=UPI000F4DAA38|nr:sporulation protein Cse60 [Bacillus sp. FJAT-42376]AZB44029.1 sporulation protein Cse60 [Bacillus sp. FJAT-42376]
MKVAVFDEEHEKDLEKEVNHFLSKLDDEQLVDVKFSVAASCDAEGEQVYCFSAMILYRT